MRSRISYALLITALVFGLLTPVLWPTGASAVRIPQPPNSSPFQMIGLIESATLDPACPAGDLLCGGTVTVQGITVIIPRNMIVAMPAAWLSWQEVFDFAPLPWGLGSGPLGVAQTGLALADINPVTLQPPLGSYEITVQGNRILMPDGTNQYVAGMVNIAQHSLSVGQGFINCIDYTNAELHVGGVPNVCAPTDARVQINDPPSVSFPSGNGRFSKGLSPDVRFTVDQDNPTIHAVTGYPMCLPRTDPTSSDDLLCPQKNRPVVAGAPMTSFTIGTVANANTLAGVTAPAFATADPTQQAPFKVGDYVDYAGILVKDATGVVYTSAWQVIAKLGIYTSPGVDPAHIVTEVLNLGVAGNAIPGVPQETTTRIVLVAFTTDPTRSVNLYAVDQDPCSGVQTLRLITGSTPIVPEVVPWGRFRYTPQFSTALPPTREWKLRISTLLADPAPVANGLIPGRYQTPIGAYIFNENTVLGDPILVAIPLNLQDFPALTQGWGPWRTGFCDGVINLNCVAQLTPFPLNESPGLVGLMTPAVPAPVTCIAGQTVKPPVVSAGTPQTVASGALVTLTGTATDPNGNALPLTPIWTQISGPLPFVTLSAIIITGTNPITAKVTFTAPTVTTPTTLGFRFTATNSQGLSASATTSVTVNPPPVAADTVIITAATYRANRGEVNVTATSNATPLGVATLFLTVANNLGATFFGPIQLTNNGGGLYSFTQRGIFPPTGTTVGSYTVTSDHGGTAKTGVPPSVPLTIR